MAPALLFRGTDFEKIEVDPDIVYPHNLALGDMDGDRDLYALINGHASQNVVWFESPVLD